ncbi:hypothetical protein AnigIFM59636_001820 [Aspergillus niger]|nr:hypothetical protein AnigIFM59636_001820 [Aspergillus niger]
MEETGHIDWLYGVGKPETATGAPVVVAGKEVERSVRKTRVRLETKVLQKSGSLMLQDQKHFTDQEWPSGNPNSKPLGPSAYGGSITTALGDPQILIRSLIAEPEGVGFPAPLDLNSGHGLPHCCSGPHPLVTMAGLSLFVREEVSRACRKSAGWRRRQTN